MGAEKTEAVVCSILHKSSSENISQMNRKVVFADQGNRKSNRAQEEKGSNMATGTDRTEVLSGRDPSTTTLNI